MRKQLRDLGIRSKVFICGNGVDISLIDKVPTRSLLFDGIFVGRLVSDKGVSETLRIFEKICRKNTDAKFAFIGGGDANTIQTLRREIVKRNLEKNVSLLGYVSERERLFELMKRSKVFVYPTHLESWGTVVGEALACGLPVICYDLPAFRELFSCEAVRICDEGNVDQMIAETERLIQDPAERNRLGRVGRDYVKRYTWDEVAEREAQIYRLLAE
jgi:glycosyltransferase involved in cell wall biosynthesis